MRINSITLTILAFVAAKCEEHTKMWDDVYGFKMSAMKQKRKLSPIVETMKEENCITSTFKVLFLDLVTCEYVDASFQSHFELTSMRDGHITGLTGYFDTGFTQGQNLKTSFPQPPLYLKLIGTKRLFLLRSRFQLKKVRCDFFLIVYIAAHGG